jgi:Ca-activated chloride channel family protein
MNAPDFPLHFLRPWWWLALLPLPLALWALARSGGGRAALARLADAALLPHLIRDSGARQRFALTLFAIAWLLAVAALSGPAWKKVAKPLYVNGAARVVALSLSDDMLAQDLQPDRMTRARFAVRDLLDDAGDARTALVAYAGAAFTVAPLTEDKQTVLNLLRALRPDVMPVPGNDAAAGIEHSVALLEQSHVKGGEIVVVTDSADAAAIAAAKAARARGIRVDVLGIGTAEGAPVPQRHGGFARGTHGVLMARRDDAALRAVARAGGGRYVVLNNGGDVTALGKPLAESGRASHAERAQLWRDGGIWLLPVLLLLGALAFRRGWLLVLALLALPVGMPVAHASTWDSLWANHDQRALQALRHGDAIRARKLATTQGMRGAADYRAGDYAKAARAFASGDDARSRYNLGNALAKQGDYRKAIAAYRDALKLDPKFTDARANLNAVEDWLKRHAPPHRQGSKDADENRHGNPPSSSRQGAPTQNDNGQRSAQAGSPREHASSKGRKPSQSNAGSGAQKPGTRQQSGKGGKPQPDRGETSVGEAAKQRQQAKRAAQGLARELRQAKGSKNPGKDGGARAFALGRNQPKGAGRFNPQQRAMLQAVPDDPGALLRRKFRLEWEQRHGQRQEEPQQ